MPRFSLAHFPLVVRPGKEPWHGKGCGELAGTAMVDALVDFLGNVARNLAAYLAVAVFYAAIVGHPHPFLLAVKVAAVFLGACTIWFALGIWWPLRLDLNTTSSEKVVRFSAAFLLFLAMAKTLSVIY